MKGGVRERSKGKWSYYFKYKDEFDNWKTKEKGGFKTKKEAESALRKSITEFEEDGYLSKKTTYTVEQYIKYWFENVADLKLKHNTIINYKSAAKKHIYNEIGHISIDKITPVVMQKFITDKNKACCKSTVAHIKKVLNGSFSLAVKQRIIKNNPLRDVENIGNQREEKDASFLDKEQINIVIDKVSKNKYYLPILIAIHTGLRRGEVLGLTWDNIDLDNRIITVNKQLLYQKKKLILSSPKTKTSNRQFLIPSLLAIELQRAKTIQEGHLEYYGDHYHTENNFVCCEEDGTPFRPYELTTYTSELSNSLGMNFTFHDLRHTHATLLLEADVNVKVIQERLGHSNINTTLNIYSHVSKKLEYASIDKFEKLFATQKEVMVANQMAK